MPSLLRPVCPLLLPVVLLGLLPPVGHAARPVVFTGEPVVVRLQLRQPTAVQFPEPIAAVPTGADPHTLSLELDGPRLFLQPLTPDVHGQLFVLGVSGRSYPLRFAVGRPADTEVVVTLPPAASGAGSAPLASPARTAPPALASPVTVRDLLVGMLRDTPPPGVSVAPHAHVVLETTALRITTVRVYTTGTLQGYVAEAVNRGIRVRRDSWVSVMYSTELNSATSSVILQSTDRQGILGQKPTDFQLSV